MMSLLLAEKKWFLLYSSGDTSKQRCPDMRMSACLAQVECDESVTGISEGLDSAARF